MEKIIKGEEGMETKENRVSSENLLKEIAVLIKDEIIANYKEENGSLVMNLLNGQKFSVSVKEF